MAPLPPPIFVNSIHNESKKNIYQRLWNWYHFNSILLEVKEKKNKEKGRRIDWGVVEESIRELLFILISILPCSICQQHAIEIYIQSETKMNTMRPLDFSIFFHDQVNIKLNKSLNQQHRIYMINFWKNILDDYNNTSFRKIQLKNILFWEQILKHKSTQLILDYYKKNVDNIDY
jgi:hypothetical protein